MLEGRRGCVFPVGFIHQRQHDAQLLAQPNSTFPRVPAWTLFSSQQLLFGEYVCLAILSFPYAFQTLGMAGGILSVSNFKSVSYSLSRF